MRIWNGELSDWQTLDESQPRDLHEDEVGNTAYDLVIEALEQQRHRSGAGLRGKMTSALKEAQISPETANWALLLPSQRKN